MNDSAAEQDHPFGDSLAADRPSIETSLEGAASPLFPEGMPATRSTSAPVGPGLGEALLWMAGFFAIEISGAFVWLIGLMVYKTLTEGSAAPKSLDEMMQPVMPWMIGSCKLVEVVAVLIAIRFRFGPSAFRITGFRSFSGLHAAVMGFAVLPTAFASGQLYALLRGYWDQLAERVPRLKWIDELSSIETVQQMADSTPLFFLVLIIAVLPALNEEFMFRAAIGRGLLGRYGLIAGIALTSMLFGAMHLHPVHAAALIPLAVLMHVGYLSSGSIWWPVGVHFLNNAMSVALMKLATIAPEEVGIAADVTESRFSLWLFLASLACVAATCWLLMKIRVQWKNPAGEIWQGPQPSVEPPPEKLDLASDVPRPSAFVVLAVCGAYLLFPIALVAEFALKQG